MTPTAPSTGPVLPNMAQGAAPQQSPTGAEPPAAARTLLGASAVTQAEAAAKTALGVPGHARKSVPDIPPDPPPVKGLGIPALHMREVGDSDAARDAPPPSMGELVNALRPPGPRGLDLRL
jgi:hypothetical protein